MGFRQPPVICQGFHQRIGVELIVGQAEITGIPIFQIEILCHHNTGSTVWATTTATTVGQAVSSFGALYQVIRQN